MSAPAVVTEEELEQIIRREVSWTEDGIEYEEDAAKAIAALVAERTAAAVAAARAEERAACAAYAQSRADAQAAVARDAIRLGEPRIAGTAENRAALLTDVAAHLLHGDDARAIATRLRARETLVADLVRAAERVWDYDNLPTPEYLVKHAEWADMADVLTALRAALDALGKEGA